MGCLFADMLLLSFREAAAVSVEMNQKQVIVVDCGHGMPCMTVKCDESAMLRRSCGTAPLQVDDVDYCCAIRFQLVCRSVDASFEELLPWK